MGDWKKGGNKSGPEKKEFVTGGTVNEVSGGVPLGKKISEGKSSSRNGENENAIKEIG